MKGFNRIGSLLAAAAAALFLPACGGGGDGDGQDSYMSLEQFKSGAKQFRVIGQNEMKIYAQPGAYAEPMGGDVYKEQFEKEPQAGSAGCLIAGYVKFYDTREIPANIFYYVNGGKEGSGALLVTFKGRISQDVQNSLANFTGCLTPTDIQFEGLADNKLYQIDESLARQVLVSLQGVSLKFEFQFQQQTSNGRLECATASGDGEPLHRNTVVTFPVIYVAEATGS